MDPPFMYIHSPQILNTVIFVLLNWIYLECDIYPKRVLQSTWNTGAGMGILLEKEEWELPPTVYEITHEEQIYLNISNLCAWMWGMYTGEWEWM